MMLKRKKSYLLSLKKNDKDDKRIEASEPKGVNLIGIQYGVNSFWLGGFQSIIDL